MRGGKNRKNKKGTRSDLVVSVDNRRLDGIAHVVNAEQDQTTKRRHQKNSSHSEHVDVEGPTTVDFTVEKKQGNVLRRENKQLGWLYIT